MKKYIMYYYNLEVRNISYENNRYFVSDGKKEYIFEECKKAELCEYYQRLINQIQTNAIGCFFKIIKNINGDYISYVNGVPYVLLYSDINNYRKSINITDLTNERNNIVDIQGLEYFIRYPWNLLWEKKIDYIENWYLGKQQLYRKEMGIIWFLIGLGENAITYFKNIVTKDKEMFNKLTLQHNRIVPNMKLYDYYDINNIIIDHSSRDLAEYIKGSILQDKFDIDVFDKYLREINLSVDEIELLYARILFPSCFFDELEKYINLEEYENNNFDYLEDRLVVLCNDLKKIGECLEENYKINTIKWL